MNAIQSLWGKLSLIGRLLVTTSIALLVAGSAMVFVSARQEAAEVRADLQIELAKELETLPATLAETVIIGDFATLQQTLDRYVTHPLIATIEFIDVKGSYLSSHDKPVQSAVPAWFLTLFAFSDIEGRTTVTVGGRNYGEIHLTLTAQGLANRAWTRLKSHLEILLLAVLLAFIGIWWVLRQGLAPLKQLEAGTNAMAAGNLAIDLTPGGSPELRHVIESFIRMAQQVRSTQADLEKNVLELNAILDNSSVGIAFVRERKIVWVNQRMGELFGYTPAEIDRQSTRMFFPSAAAYEDLGRKGYAALARGSRYVSEQEMQRKDGSLIWSRLSGKAITTDDLNAGSIWIFEDISDQKRGETELRAAKEASDVANIAKSRFLATMSHEIRTPMNGILGMAQLLLMPNLQDSERRDYARTILNSGQTLLSLLNDILDLSKVEAGKLELESSTLEPGQIVHEIRALFTEAAAHKGLSIEAHWIGPAQRYLGDPHRLRQMLSNLVGNAIKFTAHGQVRIEAHEVERSGKIALLEFIVTDTGIGIPEDKQSTLFKPFTQADSSITRQFGGTGLGLSIVRSLARLMGGDVGVESLPDQGSRFWFRIKTDLVADGADSRQATRSGEQGASSVTPPTQLSGHVLIVEDNPTNQKVIAALLRKLGLSTSLAEDGQQAVDAITQGQGNTADLVLMDLQMPVMDGYIATERIRQWETENGRPRQPIIALTADAFEEDRQHCMASGMDDFLTKPIAVNALAAVLGKWLAQTHR